MTDRNLSTIEKQLVLMKSLLLVHSITLLTRGSATRKGDVDPSDGRVFALEVINRRVR
ncbi:MAG: hypothetical protein ACXAEU_02510 [Candidatus Hodarchaeales archaeon]